MNKKKDYAEAIEKAFQIYKNLSLVDIKFFNKDKTSLQLFSTIFKHKEDNFEECLEGLSECKKDLNQLKSWKGIPEDVDFQQYIDLLGENIQLFIALITVLKEAKEAKQTISFYEYEMMINYFRTFQKRLNSREEVRIGCFLEECERRGLFGKQLRPLLYSDQVKLHYSFTERLNSQVAFFQDKIQEDFLDKTIFWLIAVPEQLFEFVFLPDENGNISVPVLRGKIEPNGIKCAHITQAFVLWNLEQILKNSKDYQSELGLSIEHFEILTHDSIIGRNEIQTYLQKYREEFTKKYINPRDWALIYVWDICDVLIPDEKKRMEIMREWNDDTLEKGELISEEIRFFANAKKKSLELKATI